jgi:hypothetical protein
MPTGAKTGEDGWKFPNTLTLKSILKEEQGYPVEITVNGEQQWDRGYMDPKILPWVPGLSSEEDGQRLFEKLLADDRLKEAWAEVRGSYPQRRIRLRIDDSAPELHTIPWESLRDEGDGSAPQDLAAQAATPFSRFLAGKWHPGSPILQRPVKVLVAIANPTNLKSKYNLEPVEVEKEIASLKEAVAGLESEIIIVPLPQPHARRWSGSSRRISHPALHRPWQLQRRQGRLACTWPARRTWDPRCMTTEFRDMLARQLGGAQVRRDDQLRLVFLSSCERQPQPGRCLPWSCAQAGGCRGPCCLRCRTWCRSPPQAFAGSSTGSSWAWPG